MELWWGQVKLVKGDEDLVKSSARLVEVARIFFFGGEQVKLVKWSRRWSGSATSGARLVKGARSCGGGN